MRETILPFPFPVRLRIFLLQGEWQLDIAEAFPLVNLVRLIHLIQSA